MAARKPVTTETEVIVGDDPSATAAMPFAVLPKRAGSVEAPADLRCLDRGRRRYGWRGGMVGDPGATSLEGSLPRKAATPFEGGRHG